MDCTSHRLGLVVGERRGSGSTASCQVFVAFMTLKLEMLTFPPPPTMHFNSSGVSSLGSWTSLDRGLIGLRGFRVVRRVAGRHVTSPVNGLQGKGQFLTGRSLARRIT